MTTHDYTKGWGSEVVTSKGEVRFLQECVTSYHYPFLVFIFHSKVRSPHVMVMEKMLTRVPHLTKHAVSRSIIVWRKDCRKCLADYWWHDLCTNVLHVKAYIVQCSTSLGFSYWMPRAWGYKIWPHNHKWIRVTFSSFCGEDATGCGCVTGFSDGWGCKIVPPAGWGWSMGAPEGCGWRMLTGGGWGMDMCLCVWVCVQENIP